MAAIRFSMLKSLGSCVKFARNLNEINGRSLSSLVSCTKFRTKESVFPLTNVNNDFKLMGLKASVADKCYRNRNRNSCASTFSPMGENLISHGDNSQFDDFKLMGWKASVATQYYRNRNTCASTFSPIWSNLISHCNISPFGGRAVLMSYRWNSSSPVGSQGDNTRGTEVPVASSGTDVSDGGFGGANLLDKVKNAWQSAVDAANYTGEKVKEVSNELTPYAQQLLDTHPYPRDVIVPVGCTLTGTMLVWFVMPRVLRRFHKYSTQGPAALLSGSSLWGPVPYENSFWGAMEDPLRYLVTFMAFKYIGMMAAPTTIASQYISQAWRGAIILSLVWFLHRWKTNVVTRALAVKSTEGLVERDKLLTIDKVSSVGLFVLGVMALTEACGVAVQSILTVRGIGGVATTFASRDILGNVLSGLSVQVSRSFSVGDTIKAGSVEGQVIEMGLTTTRLLSAEKFPVIVPNSLFSSQVIVNKSRAGWRALLNKIPLQIGDFDKIPQISEDIKNMLKSNSNLFLEKEVPFCYMSLVERSYAELTLGYNLKYMVLLWQMASTSVLRRKFLYGSCIPSRATTCQPTMGNVNLVGERRYFSSGTRPKCMGEGKVEASHEEAEVEHYLGVIDVLGNSGHLHEKLGKVKHPGLYKDEEKLRDTKKKDRNFLLNFNELDNEIKKSYILAHSERLAVAFGLINTPARASLRIIKQQLMCRVCHRAFKNICRIVGREIIVRDMKYVHVFKDGKCSCKDRPYKTNLQNVDDE